MSGPSTASWSALAIRAAEEALRNQPRGVPMRRERDAAAVLSAAHDPVLGLDRSVCLRDVVEYLQADDVQASGWLFAAAVGRVFGGLGP